MFPLCHENHWLTKEGRRRWIAWSNTALLDSRGAVQHVIATGIDETERLAAEQARTRAEQDLRAALADTELKVRERTTELARSNRDLEQFAYVASHDLQEPLRMVASFTQLLADRYRDRLDADAMDFIGYAVEGATRMRTLISDLLAYSRIGTKGSPFAPTSFTAAAETAMRNLTLAIEETGARVCCDALPTLLADESQIVRVFQNLIGNSIKFRSAETPDIRISARRADGRSPGEGPGPGGADAGGPDGWIFSVRDNGIGLEPEHMNRIFEIFQRLHTRAEYPGSGIGLAVCKKIIERHGGRIWVESAKGRGSTFCFAMPERPDKAASGAA
jgi:light-regulated signal transduction histidine kinase (bacteriophytochrome)